MWLFSIHFFDSYIFLDLIGVLELISNKITFLFMKKKCFYLILVVKKTTYEYKLGTMSEHS